VGGTDSASESVPDLILADVTIVDGTGTDPRPGQTIEVTNGRITSIRPTASGDSATVDVLGSFVTPGLIDAHMHLAQGEGLHARLEDMLRSGVTSIREMANFMPQFADSISTADSTSFPRIFWSAFWAGPTFMGDPRCRDRYDRLGDVPWLLAVTDTTDVDAHARAARDLGVSGIKILSDLAPADVRRITQAGHAAGLDVWTHAVVFPTKPSDVVASGVDVISHAAFFVWEVPEDTPLTYNEPHPWTIFGPPAPYATVSYDDPAVLPVLDSMRARDVILDPTLTLMHLQGDTAFTWAVNLTRIAHEMGIPIAVGTDTRLIFDEIEALVNEVDLTPLEAIRSATAVAAAAIGVAEDLGTVEVGKRADLVVYPVDPSSDISALRRPAHVIKAGRLVDGRVRR
jgi:hypothetical protein